MPAPAAQQFVERRRPARLAATRIVGGVGRHPWIARLRTLVIAAVLWAVLGAIAPGAVRHQADRPEKLPQSLREAAPHRTVVIPAHPCIYSGCARGEPGVKRNMAGNRPLPSSPAPPVPKPPP